MEEAVWKKNLFLREYNVNLWGPKSPLYIQCKPMQSVIRCWRRRRPKMPSLFARGRPREREREKTASLTVLYIPYTVPLKLASIKSTSSSKSLIAGWLPGPNSQWSVFLAAEKWIETFLCRFVFKRRKSASVRRWLRPWSIIICIS